jgi:negative regulator of flagellin synthesis FlgM
MKINPVSSEVVRSDRARELQRSASERQQQAPRPAQPAQRGDQVQISEAGRALAAKTADPVREALSPERVAEVRERILSGAYNSLEVVEQVARKMLASGDI